MNKQIELNEKERRELEKCLIIQIDLWECKLEEKRGTNVESVILERLSTLRTMLDKVQSV